MLRKTLVGLTLGLLAATQTLATTLVVGDQSYNTRTVMEAAGVLDDLPYQLDWKQFTAGSPVAEALNVGSLDLGLLGDAPPLFLGALGAPIKVVGISRQSLDGVAVLVRGDSSIRSLADLQGKTVAIWKGSWSQQLALSALDRAGVPRDRVSFRYLNALDASHALEGGSVDAIATWEPYVTQAQRHGARVLTTAEDLIPAQSFVVASQRALDDAAKHRAIGDFLQRLQRARTWANADPAHMARYARAWAERTRADAAIAQAWFARARTSIGPVTPAAIAQAQRTVDFFAGEGLVKGYDASRLFYDGFGTSLAPLAQTAQR
ncbi:ABC transporter substrate-binding protein [Pseudomonas oryzihabitans]|uniref:ABC transporter substrate-binding protein n=1 Tax=Pseudomonas oryzihabitans TaxID=47885 RepID=UPI00135EBDA2|nr:ABC transporter substrate-binding protein [Pseudomonas oryzihabitans]MXS19543.1 aliphatic sulfonate ABC transporter substrate-binding protein [Pseudomonas oryzihabitans]